MGESLEALKTMEEELRGREFFGGESLRFVDLVVGWTPHWVLVFEEVAEFNILDADAVPSLHAWNNMNCSLIRAFISLSFGIKVSILS